MHLKEAGKNGLRPNILLRRSHPLYYDCGIKNLRIYKLEAGHSLMN